MHEASPNIRTKEQELISFWSKYPVVLASQSDFRKHQLIELGFSQVTASASIPESIETTQAKDLNESQGIPSYYADDGRDVVRHIAGSKVRYVLDHQQVGPEAIILAFDTAPLIWCFDKEKDEYTFEHLEKPKGLEEGRILIQHIITKTAVGCLLRQKRIAEYQKQFADLPSDVKETTITNLTAVLDIGTISIVSAASGSFPSNRNQVLGFSDEVSLFSHTIDEMANDPQALEVLGDKIAALMSERVTQISGGIDYTDNFIRDLLNIEELKLNIQEGTTVGINHYLGLSLTSLLILLAYARGE